MDQNEYPRPDFAAGPYAKDKSWGIAIIVFSVLGICAGGAITAGGGVLSAVGTGTAVSAAGTQGAREAQTAGAAAGMTGGIVMLLGIALFVLSAVRLVGGLGVIKGTRTGFLISAVVSGLLILLNIPSIATPSSIIGIVVSGLILFYCYQRLTGKEGPALT